MCASPEKFNLLRKSEGSKLALANNSCTQIDGRGTVKIKTNSGCRVTLNETLYVPDLRTNLLSVPKMTQHGLKVTFTKNKAVVTNPSTGALILTAERKQDLYLVEETHESAAAASAKPKSLQDWHEAYGHLNERDLKAIINKRKVIGINADTGKNLLACSTCIQGKQTQKPFQKSTQKASEILEIVHSDVCGPMRTQSFAGSRYFVTFIDDKSRWCTIYFLKSKSEVFEKFKEYKYMAENQTGKKIKCLRSDNGTEYTCNAMRNFLKTAGIRQEFTIEYTPQQNGVAERKNRTIVEMARCMMIQSGLPPAYWAEAVNTANYIRNRCPSQSLDGEIPYQAWTGKTPYAGHLQKFGCTAFALDKKPGKCKFGSKSTKCIFVGYTEASKGYRLWDPVGRKIRRSRDVTFVSAPSVGRFEEFAITDEIELGMRPQGVTTKEQINSNENNPDDHLQLRQTESTSESDTEAYTDTDVNTKAATSESDTAADVDIGINTKAATKRGRGRPRKIRKGGRGRPRKGYNMIPTEKDPQKGEESTSECEQHAAASMEHSDPETSTQALASPEANEWKKAMLKEYKTLMKNRTWEIVDQPNRKKIVESKWALRTKYTAQGTIDCRKARLVAKGFTQRAGVDYDETFAPVARMNTIRVLMAMSVEMGLEVHQLDFVSAYLNGTIETEIYMRLPSDLYDVLDEEEAAKYSGNKICRLKKAIYGLKQSGRLWYQKLDQKLKEMHMSASQCDPCMYFRRQNDVITYIAIYVDDIIVASNNTATLKEVKKELASSFEMKDLGPLKYCLGIEFSQNTNLNKITMCQSKYVSHILKKFNMTDCKTVSTPANSSIKLSRDMSPKTKEEQDSANKLPYQNLVGSLMYLAVSTRPDIAHVVSALSQFNTCYGNAHWTAAKRVLRYLKHTPNLGICFSRTGDIELEGFVDADWGSSIDDRRSYTGYAFKCASAAISWESRKQRTVAVSSTEAEYMALSDSAKEAVYLKRFLKEISGKDTIVTVYNDNQGAEKLSKNPIFHNRTKHVDIRHHFVREIVERGDITIQYMRTEEMPADVLTKNLPTPKHVYCIENLGMKEI